MCLLHYASINTSPQHHHFAKASVHGLPVTRQAVLHCLETRRTVSIQGGGVPADLKCHFIQGEFPQRSFRSRRIYLTIPSFSAIAGGEGRQAVARALCLTWVCLLYGVCDKGACGEMSECSKPITERTKQTRFALSVYSLSLLCVSFH